MGSISFGSGRERKTLAEAERRRSTVERRKVFGANRGKRRREGNLADDRLESTPPMIFHCSY